MSTIKSFVVLIAIAICCSLPATSLICGHFPLEGKKCSGTTDLDFHISVSEPIEINETTEIRNISIEIQSTGERVIKNLTLEEIFPANVSLIDFSLQGTTEKPKIIKLESNSNGTTKLIKLNLGILNESENRVLNLTVEYEKFALFSLDRNELRVFTDPDLRPLPTPPQ